MSYIHIFFPVLYHWRLCILAMEIFIDIIISVTKQNMTFGHYYDN